MNPTLAMSTRGAETSVFYMKNLSNDRYVGTFIVFSFLTLV